MKQLSYLSFDTVARQDGNLRPHTHVQEIIRGLERRGWQVKLYAPGYLGSQPSVWARLREFLRIQIRLWRDREKPDVVYIRNHVAAFPTSVWARLKKIPVVWEVNGPYEDLFIAWPWTRRMRPLFEAFIRKPMQWADAVVAVTPQLARWAEKEGAQNVFVVPNAANTEMFRPGREPAGDLELPPQYVLFFGSLAPWQGIDTILQAVELPDWPREMALVVVGDGVERPKVEMAARGSRKIMYLGPQPYEKMPGVIAGSRVALVPKMDFGIYSSTGLAPLKVFESLACGVPVIVTDLPFMADLIREGKCGIVIPPGDAKALAKAVRFLYEHPEKRREMGRRGRVLVETKHSWDRRAAETEQILKQMWRQTEREQF